MNLCFVLTGDLETNSRAKRQVSALVDAGAEVTVLHFPAEPQTQRERDAPSVPPAIADDRATTALPVSKPTRETGPLRFWQIHRNTSKRLDTTLSGRKFTHLHASDLYVLPAVATRGQSAGLPVSFDSRELYAHVAATTNKPWSRVAWHLLQKRYLPTCKLVFTVSDGIADQLLETYAIRRPIVVRNLPSTTSEGVGSEVRSALGLPESAFLCLHLGQARADRGCEAAVAAIGKLPAAHLAFVGNAPLKASLSRLAEKVGASKRVHFLPPVPPERVTSFARTADIGLSLLPRTCLNHDLALPNKFFEYIAAGVPVVVSRLREMSRLVEDHQIGMSVEHTNDQALADALALVEEDRDVRKSWAANCRRLSQQLTWDTEKKRFVEALTT